MFHPVEVVFFAVVDEVRRVGYVGAGIETEVSMTASRRFLEREVRLRIVSCGGLRSDVGAFLLCFQAAPFGHRCRALNARCGAAATVCRHGSC